MAHYLVSAKPHSDLMEELLDNLRKGAYVSMRPFGTQLFPPERSASRGWICHMGGGRLLLASVGRGKGRGSGWVLRRFEGRACPSGSRLAADKPPAATLSGTHGQIV